MKSPYFLIRRVGKQFRGYIVAKNGKVVWRTSNYHTSRVSALKSIRVVRDAIRDFHLVDD